MIIGPKEKNFVVFEKVSIEILIDQKTIPIKEIVVTILLSPKIDS